MSQPRISVIMPVWSGEKYLAPRPIVPALQTPRSSQRAMELSKPGKPTPSVPPKCYARRETRGRKSGHLQIKFCLFSQGVLNGLRNRLLQRPDFSLKNSIVASSPS